MTHKQMADQVAAWLGLQDIAVLDETQLVDQLLYQGTIDMLARTRCVARCVQLRTSPGIDTYTLDHAILSLVDVEDGRRHRARRDQDYVQDELGPGRGWGCDGRSHFTLIRSDVLRLDPTPDEDTGTIQVWAVMRPQPMVEDGDSPGDEAFGAIPDEFQDAIVTYALWKASDYADDVSSQQGERYRTLYEGPDGRGGRIQAIKIAVNTRGTARAPKARVLLRPQRPHRSWVG